MPTLPWKTVAASDAPEVVVMASRLEVRSLAQAPGFLLASLALWRQALRAPGAVGVALKADPLRRTFWTVSAWTDEQAIRAYAGTEPHRSTMRRKRSVMKESTFVFWNSSPADLPVSWDTVRARIAEQRAARPS
ncbi:DUF3291 domain-containing protein [Actinocorallia sp. API 0066]|uniref:DUF3291 domain-containing protein n=1 Tax=Actinocorallia sp. API 0066 TaxID=2896846 RepID=UPI001E5BD458|nr:DUF3291 domain-containing protein [Actinocorallia sp. API 0066]MCD0451581.1 DUF3291 domain-containing protein [Actinocorallia sp. API 0066]